MNATDADTGLADERTSLAWQRTALAVAAGGALFGRLTFARLGIVALTVLVFAIALSLCALHESGTRYRRHERQARGGRTTLTLSTATSLLAAIEAVALTTH
ncbi:DUF202 domain-containing protein [Rhodococcus sp. NPDC056960]|uniref:DUF202 domain-containing protein n=1 Tax=Rhodococcus sp. NPDC056960 TaxID=3345982 RepID=UPI00362FAD59